MFFFSTGHLPDKILLTYKGRRDLGATYLRNVRSYSVVAGTLLDKHIDPELEQVIDNLRTVILANHTTQYSLQQAVDWMDNMTTYINQIDLVKVDLADHITQV